MAWVEPLPEDAEVVLGVFSSTLLIYNLSVEHTRFYECMYTNMETEQHGAMPDDMAFIYIYVQGKQIF